MKGRISIVRPIILLLALFVIFGCKEQTKETATQATVAATVTDISVDEAKALIEQNKDNPDFVILDVRTPGEYQSGHIAGAVLLDYYSADFKNELAKLDKNKIYLVYCRSGNRSRKAAQVMKELQFTKVYNMLGGVIAWQNKEYPLVKD